MIQIVAALFAVFCLGTAFGINLMMVMIKRGWTVYQKKSESIKINYPIIRSMSAAEFVGRELHSHCDEICREDVPPVTVDDFIEKYKEFQRADQAAKEASDRLKKTMEGIQSED